jgi:hypothetical protein
VNIPIKPGEGKLLTMREASAVARMGLSTLGRAIQRGHGPQAIRRPGLLALFTYESWLHEWLTTNGFVEPTRDRSWKAGSERPSCCAVSARATAEEIEAGT